MEVSKLDFLIVLYRLLESISLFYYTLIQAAGSLGYIGFAGELALCMLVSKVLFILAQIVFVRFGISPSPL